MFASPFLCHYHANKLQPRRLQSCRKQSDDLKLCFRAVPVTFNKAKRDGDLFKMILARSSETESRTVIISLASTVLFFFAIVKSQL